MRAAIPMPEPPPETSTCFPRSTVAKASLHACVTFTMESAPTNLMIRGGVASPLAPLRGPQPDKANTIKNTAIVRLVRTAASNFYFSHSAHCRAQYVMMMSAPARLKAVICSITHDFSSSQPFAAAAFSIAYSPLTL